MANGYNPYNVVGTQQGLLESLLGAEQAQKTGTAALGQQKGEMSEEFQKELIAAQKEQERLLQQGRKKGFLEKLAPMLGLIPGVGSIAGGALGGLTGMYGAKKGSDFAKQQIEKARGAGLGSQWGGTFLGGQAREATATTETMLDKMKREADVSGMDLLKTGVTSGVSGYAMGKLGEGIGEAFATPDADVFGPLNIGETRGLQGLDLLSSGVGTDGKFFEKLMKGLGQDPSTLLGEGGKGQNILKNLLLMISQMGGDR